MEKRSFIQNGKRNSQLVKKTQNENTIKGFKPLETLRRIVQEVDSNVDLVDTLLVIARWVKNEMGVHVCSLYLTDQFTGRFVLMATEGLNPSAIGRVELAPNEGLVGLVAERLEPMNIGNASAHPHYKFVPECGEEPYRSFLGVPVLHQRKLLGVLVVQQKSARRFKHSDVAFLVTLAAHLASAIALATAKDPNWHGRNRRSSGQYIEGLPGAPGVAVGTGVVVFGSLDLNTIPNRIPENPDAEEVALQNAVARAGQEMRKLSKNLHGLVPDEDRALFDAYATIVESDALVDAALERIHAGNWAPGALREVIEQHARQFDAIEDPYLRDRANDIRDIGRRILAHLQEQEPVLPEYTNDTILVGENLSPVDLALVPPELLAGVVSGYGSVSSHLSILARSLGVPTITGIASSITVSELDGKRLALDGYRGRLYVEPADPVRREFRRLVREEKQLLENLKTLRDQPAQTPDGVRINLYTNMGMTLDLSHSIEVGAEGVGLYRTEFPFMLANRFPSEQEQRAVYRQALETFAPRPVVLRTLDIGGDKELPYLPIDEKNPFLGWRGIRVTLDHPEIFLTQMRAMLQASLGLNNLCVLFPMISGVEELDEALVLLQRAYDELKEEHTSLSMPPCGIMVEVPAAVFHVNALAKRVQFISIGTNDLTQYLLAVDRNNEQVARLFDSLHPALLRAIMEVIDAAQRNKKPVSVCGEAAGDPAMVILLLAMGVDSLSVSAGDLPRVKQVIRGISRSQACELLAQVLDMETPGLIRERLNRALTEADLGNLIRPGK